MFGDFFSSLLVSAVQYVQRYLMQSFDSSSPDNWNPFS